MDYASTTTGTTGTTGTGIGGSRPGTGPSAEAVPAHDLGPMTQQAAPGVDPLRHYVASLPEEYLAGTVAVSQPIAGDNSTSHGSTSLAEFAALKERERLGALRPDEAEYIRYGTPLSKLTEEHLAELYGAEQALVFTSGMAAIKDTLEAVHIDGGHIIVFEQGYRQTNALLERWAKRGMIELSLIPIEDFATIGKHLRPNTKAVFFETPSNPFLRVIDIRSVKQQLVAAQSDALLIVDDTFAPPPNQLSFALGADLVVPSLTKYISGSNRVLAGAVLGNKKLLKPINDLRSQSGTIAHDHDCRGILEGLTTLEGRLDRANENGSSAARLLAASPLVTKLYYPGHPLHPDYAIACPQMRGFGGVVSFCIDTNDLRHVAAFTDAFVRAAPPGTFIAPSFGGDSPLISAVAVVSHFSQPEDERTRRGIPLNLMRLSCGTYSQAQLSAALNAALEALQRSKSGQ